MTALLLTGILGVLGMTWMFPVLAALIWPIRISRDYNGVPDRLISARTISILVPVHNGEKILSRTLGSVYSSIRYLSRKYSSVSVEVVVCADGCSDLTSSVAEAYGARVIVDSSRCGKWSSLGCLLRAASLADIVVFADAGCVWKRELLAGFVEAYSNPVVLAVCPSYERTGGGVAESLLWRFERSIKKLESISGGPVSVHGATVSYRRKELENVMTILGKRGWLNDDVVIPLTLRTLYPDGIISYLPELAVTDPAPETQPESTGPEFARRLRMLHGNLQWICRVMPFSLASGGPAGILCLRRFFRVFWAWWLALLCAGIAGTATGTPGLIVLLAISICFYLARKKTVAGWPSLWRLGDAFSVSILAPYHLFSGESAGGGVTWQ